MENVRPFYDSLEYFTAIWYNLWPFGIVCGDLVYFSKFGMFGSIKIWQPWNADLSYVGSGTPFGRGSYFGNKMVYWDIS
jgi:hypothetical protein